MRIWAILGAAATLTVLVGFAPASAPEDCAAGYVVKPHDTLYSIARRCGVDLPALIRANRFIYNERKLEIGWRLAMPVQGAINNYAAPDPAPVRGGRYVVRRGDTIYKLARAIGVNPRSIIRLNPRISPDHLYPGQRLRLPTGARKKTPRVAPPPKPAAEASPPPPVKAPPPPPRPERKAPPPPPAPKAPPPSPPARTATMPYVDRSAPEGLFRVRGTVTDEGSECPVIRSDNGDRIAMAGSLGRIAPGDRVVVEGRPSKIDSCLGGRTIAVERIQRIG